MVCFVHLFHNSVISLGGQEKRKDRKTWKSRVLQMDSLRGLLGIRRMDRIPNGWIRELFKVTKGVDERTDEGVLRWLGHVERMEDNRIDKRVYVGECAGSRSVGRPRKRWTDTVKDCLRKKRFGCQASMENGAG